MAEELKELDEKYGDLVNSKKFKSNRRFFKRNKAIEDSKKHNKELPPNNMSKKNEYIVKGWKDGNKEDIFTMTVSASSFHGDPKEYREIKAKAIKQEKCTKVNILEIVTK